MNIIADMWRYAEAIGHPNMVNDPLFKDAVKFIPLSSKIDGAFIAEFKDRIIICFQGTKNKDAWKSDFDPFPMSEGMIHQGFYDGWAFFKPIIDVYFQNLLGTSGTDFSSCTKKVYFTGHSRGGTLSPLGARHLAKNRNLPCYCITFGGAAHGTAEYREQFNMLPIFCTRVVNAWDIVPTSKIIGTVFKHIGNLEWLNTRGTGWHKWFQFMRVRDHFYSEYTKTIMQYCKSKGDTEGVEAMKIVLKRAKP
jgi:hypothetical protein